MTNSTTFTCSVTTTDASVPLGLEIWFDTDCIYNTEHLDKHITLEQVFLDDDAEHEIRFVMKNKLSEHTEIDEAGNIIKDACLIVSDAAFDGIALGHAFIKESVYRHDFNGSGEFTETDCFGPMGCNGTLTLKFTTPIYLWLLEHM